MMQFKVYTLVVLFILIGYTTCLQRNFFNVETENSMKKVLHDFSGKLLVFLKLELFLSSFKILNFQVKRVKVFTFYLIHFYKAYEEMYNENIILRYQKSKFLYRTFLKK